jgi:hypothetical protein
MAVPDWHAKQGEKKIEQIMRPSLANTRLCFFASLLLVHLAKRLLLNGLNKETSTHHTSYIIHHTSYIIVINIIITIITIIFIIIVIIPLSSSLASELI